MARITKRSLANRANDNVYWKATGTWNVLNTGTNANVGDIKGIVNFTKSVASTSTIRQVFTFTVE